MSIRGAIPTMRYHDARAMIAWLGQAFGFAPHLVVDGEAGGVMHAQLVLGSAMVMLGDARADAFAAAQQPAIPGAPVSQSPYIVVADADALYARAVGAGAEVVQEIMSPEYGGRFFACRDPEGQLWNFGSYDPWASVT